MSYTNARTPVRRTLGWAILVLAGVAAGAQQARAQTHTLNEFNCGLDFEQRIEIVPLSAEALLNPPPRAPRDVFSIVLVAGPGLQANPQALAAWQRAVDTWEGLFFDNVTITIHGDLADLGPQTLGSTSQSLGQASYDPVRSYVVNDGESDETLLNSIPTLSQLSLLLPPGFTFATAIAASKANFFALGLDASALPDPTITFNSNFASYFDYDAGDGIDPGKLDFEGICLHEIGHVLGFVSIVEQIALLRGQGSTGNMPICTLDLFRMRPGDGASNFTANPRVMTTGDLQSVQVSYTGSDYSMSTGSVLGDGRQAGHWKDDDLSGQYLGIMDPTLGLGFHATITPADRRIFGLIGWDLLSSSSVEPSLAAADFRVESAPNPFRSETRIRFDLPTASAVRLELFDVTGRLVRTFQGNAPAGSHSMVWDGRDASGREVGSGVYLYRLATGLGDASGQVIRGR